MPGLASTAVPLREAFDGALVDLDGVLYRGGSAIDHAVAELRDASTAGMALSYVTNNSARPPATVAEQIRGYGLECDEEDVLTSAQAAAQLLAEHLPERGRVLPIGGDGLRLALEHEGFTLCESAEDRPRAVVQGFSAQLTWRDLAEAAYAINEGAIHLATNLDAAIPDERGIAPGNGALVGAVVAATDRHPLASGKPTPEIFHLAAERSGARRPLVIGDRLDTDLQGAR
ncbi:MAG TPA: HAD family hydrolase, partial [Brevibacterium sp.]|nr:HAD family hydrolase [Brevibacterium sp.]